MIEVRNSKLLSSTHTCSLPNFSKKAENTFWFNKFQKQHTQLQRRVRISGKVETTFQDIMNMMKINRDYFHSEHRSGIKKQDHLPKLKLSRETISDQNAFFEKISAAFFNTQSKPKPKQPIEPIPQKPKPKPKQLKKKKFACLLPFSKQSPTLQNQLSSFLIQKQKQRYKQKISASSSMHKSISCNTSNIPGQYVPNKLLQTLHRKSHSSDWSFYN